MPQVAVTSIDDYNAEEAVARCEASYVELQAFAPSTFAITNFPSIVTQERELARYVDWNNSASNAEYFKPNHFVRGPSVETAFTPAEAEIAGRVGDCVASLTANRYGRAMRPISALLAQFGLFRAIMALQPRLDRPLGVFEVGPGNGYLGAMLVAAGLRYACMDNAQALYLWQNRLLAECAGDDFHEWVGGGRPADSSRHRVQHLPWWHYLRLRHDCPFKADVFVSNTNLGEMNHGALLYTARIARRMLEGSPLAAFMYTNIGDAKQNSLATVEGELANAGFVKVCGDLVQAFVPKGAAPHRALTALDKTIPLYNPDGSGRRHGAREILRVSAATLPNDMDFIGFVGTFSLPE